MLRMTAFGDFADLLMFTLRENILFFAKWTRSLRVEPVLPAIRKLWGGPSRPRLMRAAVRRSLLFAPPKAFAFTPFSDCWPNCQAWLNLRSLLTDNS